MVNISLPISFNICFGCSKEPSHLDGSFEYPQHMFWLRNKKINFLVRTLNLKGLSQSSKAYYLNIFCFTIYGHGGHFGQAERSKVNFDLWNLFIAIVSSGLTYEVRIMTLASTVFKK